ncbi:hypothetical protein [Paraburkholderia sp. BL10I2N1]|uniref:hypothetical protein n=1 Tax=Paraburkholderia sp. BL10I2N1 TaxID=1938796 RepID=UPI00105D6083|nr:hypothetical protein [Paraburkholderia sp. BL10I2N1]TDN69872.1 hypothetical protein B0G77_3293 [Paraburkholderia sp. BL10I2N1]
MKLIDDGNLSGWLRIALFLIGVATLFGGLALAIFPGWLRLSLFLFGFAIMAVGGLASRAHMLKIKPFDNSYKKARDSYKVKDDEEER